MSGICNPNTSPLDLNSPPLGDVHIRNETRGFTTDPEHKLMALRVQIARKLGCFAAHPSQEPRFVKPSACLTLDSCLLQYRAFLLSSRFAWHDRDSQYKLSECR